MWFLVFLCTVLELNISWLCAKLGASVLLRELSAPCLDTENWTELCIVSAGPLIGFVTGSYSMRKLFFVTCDTTS